MKSVKSFEISRVNPHLLLVCAPLFWSGSFLVGRAVVGEIPPVGLAFWRWVGAAAILIPFAWPSLVREWPIIRRNWRVLTVYAFLGVTVFHTVAYTGLQYTTVANGTLVNTSQAAMIVFLAWIWLKDRFTAAETAGVIGALLGTLVIATEGNIDNVLGFRFNIGDVYIFISGICWAIYTVMLRRHPHGLSLTAFLGFTTPLGCVLLLPVYLLEASTGYVMPVTLETVAFVAFLAIFPSIGSYYCWSSGATRLGPSTAGMYYYLLPVFGTAGAWLFLGEGVHGYHVVGASLIAWGIWLTAVRPARIRAARRKAEG